MTTSSERPDSAGPAATSATSPTADVINTSDTRASSPTSEPLDIDSYRIRGAEWLMRDSTRARVRKIRDSAGGTTGQFVWQPSPTVGAIGGQPDTFLGSPVFFDPNVASLAGDAKIMAYGDFSAEGTATAPPWRRFANVSRLVAPSAATRCTAV